MLARKTPLEPVAPGLIAVILIHVLLGALVWIALPLWKLKTPVAHEEDSLAQDRRYWFFPGDFKFLQPASEPMPVKTVNVPEPPPKEIASAVGEAMLQRPTNKIITLSPVVEAAAQAMPVVDATRPPITLMEVLKVEKKQAAEKEAAGGADMDPVLNALEEGLKREWNAPPVQQVPALQRHVAFRLSIGRQGEIQDSEMIRSSGSSLLDDSVRDAAQRLKKISQALPSSFPKDRYTVEVNFHIE